MPTSCASGSAARSPSTTSATASSSCSPGTTRRSPSDWTPSPAGSRPPPRYLEESKTRATVPQVRLWQEIEIETAGELPAFFDELVAAGVDVLPAAEQRRLERASESAKIAVELYAAWLEGTLADGTDDWAIGRERHDAMVGLRAFDGLDADAILELGWERLTEERAARAAAAREIDPTADEATVIDRVKSDQPADFDAALDAYRDAMHRARRHLIERDLATVPDDERIDVVPTPEYLRNVVPFAAYFEPAAVRQRSPRASTSSPRRSGDDPNAMREHNFASISNTSIHEAYPGHHLQLDAARRNPSLTRLLTDAPEFVEGWGMYSELMMREHGFDDGPAFRVIMHTDAIWRACRIILDIRLHRGELTVDEATDFLVEQTNFERANARAEVQWYTYRPTYPLSYLLGRTLLLESARRRSSAAGRPVLPQGLPRHAAAQRVPADQLPPPAAGRQGPDANVQVIPAIDLERGRSRIVYWPGAGGGHRRTDRPAGSDRRAVRGPRAHD